MKCLVSFAFFCVSCAWSSAADPAALRAQDFTGWPAGWIEAYRGFEEFIAVRRTFWPDPALQIHENGEVDHNLHQAPTRSTRLGLVLYCDGQEVAEVGVDRKPAGDAEMPNIFAYAQVRQRGSGIYRAGIRASTPQGYQHVFPWIWIEIALKPTSENSQGMVHPIASPGRDEDFWPNERLFLFRDYHIFPKKYNPFDINSGNRRVVPGILLKLHQDGRMTRALVSDEAERLLTWRIYRDGRLVESRSATGSAEWPVRYGWGDYRVFLGVEGPRGFMPVSNMLEFPLFPSSNGQVEVIPADANRNEIPDRVEKYVTGDGELLEGVRSALSEPSLANARAPAEGQRLEAEEIKLIRLWQYWASNLKNRNYYDYIGPKVVD
jgi:hypothetical protein